jgi:hypothetical protein
MLATIGLHSITRPSGPTGNMMQVSRLKLLCVNSANRDLTFTIVHSRDQVDEFLERPLN